MFEPDAHVLKPFGVIESQYKRDCEKDVEVFHETVLACEGEPEKTRIYCLFKSEGDSCFSYLECARTECRECPVRVIGKQPGGVKGQKQGRGEEDIKYENGS